jgi:hypothetical protein
VTARFSADTEILASEAPFRTVRGNTAPAGTPLREQVGEFVS